MPRLHFHPFCVLISTIRGFAIDINLMAIYWYSSITYLAGRNYQQREKQTDAMLVGFFFGESRWGVAAGHISRVWTASSGQRPRKRQVNPKWKEIINRKPALMWVYFIRTAPWAGRAALWWVAELSPSSKGRGGVARQQCNGRCQRLAKAANISFGYSHSLPAWCYELCLWSHKKRLIYVSMTRGS